MSSNNAHRASRGTAGSASHSSIPPLAALSDRIDEGTTPATWDPEQGHAPFVSADRQIIHAWTTVDGARTWVSLGDFAPQPHHNLGPLPSDMRSTSSRYLLPPYLATPDHAAYPVWYDNTLPWMPYRPVFDERLSGHWAWFQNGELNLLRGNPQGEGYVLDHDAWTAIWDEYSRLRSVALSIAHGLGVRHFPMDMDAPSPRARSAAELRLFLFRARGSYLEWWGFLRWILAHSPPNYSELLPAPEHWRSVVRDTPWMSLAHVGTYLDPAVGPARLPDVDLMLRHRVPVAYLWDEAARGNSSVARLDPARHNGRDWDSTQLRAHRAEMSAFKRARQQERQRQRNAQAAPSRPERTAASASSQPAPAPPVTASTGPSPSAASSSGPRQHKPSSINSGQPPRQFRWSFVTRYTRDDTSEETRYNWKSVQTNGFIGNNVFYWDYPAKGHCVIATGELPEEMGIAGLRAPEDDDDDDLASGPHSYDIIPGPPVTPAVSAEALEPFSGPADYSIHALNVLGPAPPSPPETRAPTPEPAPEPSAAQLLQLDEHDAYMGPLPMTPLPQGSITPPPAQSPMHISSPTPAPPSPAPASNKGKGKARATTPDDDPPVSLGSSPSPLRMDPIITDEDEARALAAAAAASREDARRRRDLETAASQGGPSTSSSRLPPPPSNSYRPTYSSAELSHWRKRPRRSPSPSPRRQPRPRGRSPSPHHSRHAPQRRRRGPSPHGPRPLPSSPAALLPSTAALSLSDRISDSLLSRISEESSQRSQPSPDSSGPPTPASAQLSLLQRLSTVDASPPSLLLRITDDPDAPAVSAEPSSPAPNPSAPPTPAPVVAPSAPVATFPPPAMAPALPLASAAELIAPLSPPEPPRLTSSSLPAPLQLPSVDLTHADGYLYLDSRSIVRAAAWRQRNPQASYAEFIPWLVQRGAGFTWRRAVASAEPDLPAHQMPEYLQAGHSLGDWFHYTGPATTAPLFAAWERAVRTILARPHARHFILRGGLAWHLAIEFGGPNIVRDALLGPSSSAMVFRQGDSYPVPRLVVGDRPSEEENRILVGNVSGRGLWPDFAQFEVSALWTGEWNDQAEAWFQRNLVRLRNGGGQLNHAAWRTHMRDSLFHPLRRLHTSRGSQSFASNMVSGNPALQPFGLLTLPGSTIAP